MLNMHAIFEEIQQATLNVGFVGNIGSTPSIKNIV
jgi:hypothetical protein